MKGYILSNQPGALVSYEEKKYETGDIVSIDESGFITIKGRVKRFAVINVPDPKKGEQLVLVTSCPHVNREEKLITQV